MFKASEKSGFCSRNCLSGILRPLKVFVEHVSVGSGKDGDPFLELDKPCIMCMTPCCNRPVLNVYNIEGGGRI